MTPGRAAVLAVDVGNSKTDLALVAADGRLLAAVRGPTGSHQQVGLGPGADVIEHLADIAAERAGLSVSRPVAQVGAFCLAGADTPADERRLTRNLASRSLAETYVVRNDTFAALRAGDRSRLGDRVDRRVGDERSGRRAGRPDGAVRGARRGIG